MDTREAFLKAASTLVAGFQQISYYRIAGNTAIICIIDVHVSNPQQYKSAAIPAIKALKKITLQEYQSFDAIFQESSMVLAFSWLESFLAEVEEALYLKNPANLGEQVQVKLGKICGVSSIEELLHDIVRRRIRNRSQWSLANRLKDLEDHHGFTFVAKENDIEWISDTRNEIIHNRRIGIFRVKGKRITYEAIRGKSAISSNDAERFLHIVANAVGDLYDGACRSLKITARFPLHRKTKQLMAMWRKSWPYQARPSKKGVQPLASGRG